MFVLGCPNQPIKRSKCVNNRSIQLSINWYLNDQSRCVQYLTKRDVTPFLISRKF